MRAGGSSCEAVVGLEKQSRRGGWRLGILGALSAVCLAGCESPKPASPKDETPRGYLNTPPPAASKAASSKPAPAPAAPTAPLAAVVRAAQTVLTAHGFLWAGSLDAPEGGKWVVGARCGAPAEMSQAVVRILPQGEVKVEIVSHARVGAAWAALGPAFSEPMKREAAEMEREIRASLPLTGP